MGVRDVLAWLCKQHRLFPLSSLLVIQFIWHKRESPEFASVKTNVWQWQCSEVLGVLWGWWRGKSRMNGLYSPWNMLDNPPTFTLLSFFSLSIFICLSQGFCYFALNCVDHVPSRLKHVWQCIYQELEKSRTDTTINKKANFYAQGLVCLCEPLLLDTFCTQNVAKLFCLMCEVYFLWHFVFHCV